MHQNPHQAYNQQQQLLMLQAQQRQLQNQMPQQNMNMAMTPQNQQMLMMMQMMMQQNPAMLQQLMAGGMQQPQGGMTHSGVIPDQQVSTARFGGGPMVQQQQPQQPQQVHTPGADATRFAQPKEELEEEEEISFNIPLFTASAKHGSYPLTKKLGIAPKLTAFNPKQLHSSDKVSVCFSLQDAAEQVAEEFLMLDETKTMVTADSIIVDDGFSVSTDVVMLTNLFQDDVKGLYKRLRTAYADVTNIDVAIMLNRIDERFTALTNEYLLTHLKNGTRIDRFSTDFNDLLKVLRDHYEDEEDDLWEYLSKEVKEIYTLLTEQPDEEKKSFRFLSGVNIVSFKEHSFKAGLGEVKWELVEVNPQETNNLFLLTFSKHIFELSDRKSFYFSTYDREMFKFSLNNKGEVFVVRV